MLDMPDIDVFLTTGLDVNVTTFETELPLTVNEPEDCDAS